MQRFTLTADHLKLLRAAYIGWDGCEFGAPAIDCKRPYGNGDVYRDMGRLLGMAPTFDTAAMDYEYTAGQYLQMKKLHKETKTALQIVLTTGAFQAGVYEADDGKRWRLIEAS